jgi:prepilin-type N-terminal cleavage/methylation domain-containing protein
MNRLRNSGFSLIEVMVAAGLLATVTVTVCTLGAKSLASMRVCQEYEKAWDVLDRQMVLLEQIGVANLASRSNLSGVIDDPQSQIQWKWQMNIELLDVEELYALRFVGFNAIPVCAPARMYNLQRPRRLLPHPRLIPRRLHRRQQLLKAVK